MKAKATFELSFFLRYDLQGLLGAADVDLEGRGRKMLGGSSF